MPPKKKKGKKSGKKRTERKSAKGSYDSGAQEALSELSKEFYLIQIRDLETRLSRYQKKCDELEIASDKFKSGFDQQASDKKEIVSFLKKQLEQRSDEIADLQERLIGLQQAKDNEKDQFDLQLSSLRTEMQEVKDQLTSENMVLGGKLASLEEFCVQREGLMEKFAKMDETLRNQERDHKDNIYHLEKKSVIDKDRLKKEMIVRVNNVASEFRKVSNKQIADTTKRTLRENVAINSQLAKMSDKTMELIKESDELKETEKDVKQKVDLLEHNEKELMKKNASNLKLIRMLTEKAKQQQEHLKLFEQQESSMADLKHNVSKLEQYRIENEQDIKALRTEAQNLKCELKTTVESKLAADKRSSELSLSLSHTVDALKLSLKTDKNAGDEERSFVRTQLLHTLISIMDTAADQELAFTVGDLTAAEKPSIWHYQLGDLGVVPSSGGKAANVRIASIRKAEKSAQLDRKNIGRTRSEVVKLPMLS